MGKDFRRCREVTLDLSLKSFQYKLLVRAIPTKVDLIKFGIEEDNKCVFCETEIETLEHRFWYCRHIHELWYNIAHILAPCLDLGSYLGASSVLLGGSNPELVEHIFMLTKWYIWKSKCKGKMCEQRGLMNFIRVVHANEVNISSHRVCNFSEKFTEKWDMLHTMFL